LTHEVDVSAQVVELVGERRAGPGQPHRCAQITLSGADMRGTCGAIRLLSMRELAVPIQQPSSHAPNI
jgi:hypothetical protein